MAWRLTNDMALSEPMITQLNDGYIYYKSSMRLSKFLISVVVSNRKVPIPIPVLITQCLEIDSKLHKYQYVCL